MHFVVAIDGSAESDRALEHAVDLAAAARGSVTVVHSVRPDVYKETSSEPVGSLPEVEQQYVVESITDAEVRGERVLEEAQDAVADRDVTVRTDLLYGDPVETVTTYAGENDADGIVVGHRGLSERHEAMVGSVARGILQRAPVPVTVVR